MSQRHLQVHCQRPTSQPSIQSFVKELANPAHKKRLFKKFADTERQESKMTMKRKLNIDNGLQNWKTEH